MASFGIKGLASSIRDGVAAASSAGGQLLRRDSNSPGQPLALPPAMSPAELASRAARVGRVERKPRDAEGDGVSSPLAATAAALDRTVSSRGTGGSATTTVSTSSPAAEAGSPGLALSTATSSLSSMSREDLMALSVRINKRCGAMEKRIKVLRAGLGAALGCIEDVSAVVEVLTGRPLAAFIRRDNDDGGSTNSSNGHRSRSSSNMNAPAASSAPTATSTATNALLRTLPPDALDTLRTELSSFLSTSAKGLTAAAAAAVAAAGIDSIGGVSIYPDPPFLGYRVDLDRLHDGVLAGALKAAAATSASAPGGGSAGQHQQSSSYASSSLHQLPGTITSSSPSLLPIQQGLQTVASFLDSRRSSVMSHISGAAQPGSQPQPQTPPMRGRAADASSNSDLSSASLSFQPPQDSHAGAAALSALAASQAAQIRRLTTDLVSLQRDHAAQVADFERQLTLAREQQQRRSDIAGSSLSGASVEVVSSEAKLHQHFEAVDKPAAAALTAAADEREAVLVERLQSCEQSLELERQRADAALTDASTIRKDADSARSAYDKQIEALKAEIGILKRANEEASARISAVEAHGHSLAKSQTQRLEAETAALRKSLAAANDRCKALESQLQQAREQSGQQHGINSSDISASGGHAGFAVATDAAPSRNHQQHPQLPGYILRSPNGASNGGNRDGAAAHRAGAGAVSSSAAAAPTGRNIGDDFDASTGSSGSGGGGLHVYRALAPADLRLVPAADAEALRSQLQEAKSELDQCRDELADISTQLSLARQQEAVLKAEVRQLMGSQPPLHQQTGMPAGLTSPTGGRADAAGGAEAFSPSLHTPFSPGGAAAPVPLPYLRNVIIQFICFSNCDFWSWSQSASQRKALANVIATLLTFDTDQRKKVGAPPAAPAPASATQHGNAGAAGHGASPRQQLTFSSSPALAAGIGSPPHHHHHHHQLQQQQNTEHAAESGAFTDVLMSPPANFGAHSTSGAHHDARTGSVAARGGGASYGTAAGVRASSSSGGSFSGSISGHGMAPDGDHHRHLLSSQAQRAQLSAVASTLSGVI